MSRAKKGTVIQDLKSRYHMTLIQMRILLKKKMENLKKKINNLLNKLRLDEQSILFAKGKGINEKLEKYLKDKVLFNFYNEN